MRTHPRYMLAALLALTAALAAAPAASATSAPHPQQASTARTAHGSTTLENRGQACTDGVVSVNVQFDVDPGSGLARITRVTADNGTQRGVSFADLYASTGHHRAKTYGAALNVDIPPGKTQFMGSGGDWRMTPYYVVGVPYASTLHSCGGTVVVPILN